jgi:hypothetical protein
LAFPATIAANSTHLNVQAYRLNEKTQAGESKNQAILQKTKANALKPFN